MTVRELMKAVSAQPGWVPLAAICAPPLITAFVSLFHDRRDGNRAPWKYLYSLLIFLVFVPGVFSVVTMGYTIFIAYENLLDTNIFLLFGPPASMWMTVQAMKFVGINIEALPGFRGLLGLVLMIGAASVGSLIILKMRIVVWLTSGDLLMIFLVLFVIMYAGYRLTFGSPIELDEDFDYGLE